MTPRPSISAFAARPPGSAARRLPKPVANHALGASRAACVPLGPDTTGSAFHCDLGSISRAELESTASGVSLLAAEPPGCVPNGIRISIFEGRTTVLPDA
jgi:hypothetical protein